MDKLYYFPCQVRDVLSSGSIEIMSGDGFKAYWILLCRSWLENDRATLPDDEEKLRKFARVSLDVWLEIRDEVLDCFIVRDDGRIYNEKLMSISLQQEARSKAGSKGGSKKQANRVARDVAKPKHQSLESELEAEPKTEKIKELSLPRIAPTGQKQLYPDSFEQLWGVHPKGNKKPAYKKFYAIDPNEKQLAYMINSLGIFKESEQWRDGYAQDLSRWLNEAGWENQPTVIPDRYAGEAEKTKEYLEKMEQGIT